MNSNTIAKAVENVNKLDTEIITSIISSAGAIVAAVLGAFVAAICAKKIVQESVNSRFHSYSEKPRKTEAILAQAKHDIFFVAAIGDAFTKEYLGVLEKMLKRGVMVKYLILSEKRFMDMQIYMHGKKINTSYREETLLKLRILQEKYPYLFELREFDGLMTASYLCVDILTECYAGEYMPSSVIQAMIYQYMTKASCSPITYLTPTNDEKTFEPMVVSILQMWSDAKTLEF